MLVHHYPQITSMISNIDFRQAYSERCDWIELSKEARGKVDDFTLGVIKNAGKATKAKLVSSERVICQLDFHQAGFEVPHTCRAV